jgi:hypothetical protein
MAIDSPPRPLSQDGLDALIREARQRQRRRRLLGVATVAVAAAASLAISALLSDGSPRTTSGASDSDLTTCPLNALAPSLQTQGTATQAVIFLILKDPRGLRCSISTPAVFEITENGHRAPISGNPLRVRLHATLRGRTGSYAWPRQGVWWGNWCGSGKGLRVTVRMQSRSIATRFNVPPYCNWPGHASKLARG